MTDRLVWTCSMCERAVADGEGHITVSVEEAQRVQLLREERDADPDGGELPLKELATRYEPTHWLVFHSACDPEGDSGPYAMQVEHLRTPLALLVYTGKQTAAHCTYVPAFAPDEVATACATDWERVRGFHNRSDRRRRRVDLCAPRRRWPSSCPATWASTDLGHVASGSTAARPARIHGRLP
jgi:hypothetical protein